jgi:hypothetical protein
MMAVPPVGPADTTPPDTITAGLLLLHVPPPVVLDSVSVLLAQAVEGPVIAAGIVVMVTTLVDVHVPPSV